MEQDVIKSGTRRPGRKSGTGHLVRDARHKFWYIKPKNIIVVMSEVYLDVNWKIVLAKSLFNMCKSFIYIKHGSVFFIVTLVYTCRAFFAASSENICPIYCFVHSSSQSVTQWNCIFSFTIHWIWMLHLFHTRNGPFFLSSHLSCFFCSIIRKYLSHVLFWSQLVSVCFAMKFFFSFKINCLQMFQLFQTKDGPIFFIVTLVYTCRAFFLLYHRKYLSHVLFWSQLVSVCFAMKFFFSFKIHCLQMFQLFQTKDGPIFFIVTLVYTCRAFFLLYHQKIFVPCIVLVTARLSLFRNEILFLL